MVLGKLGELIDKQIAEMRRQGQQQFADRLHALAQKGDLGDLKNYIIDHHMNAQLMAWALHSNWLPLPPSPGSAARTTIVNKAKSFGDGVVARVKAVFGAGEPPEKAKLYVEMTSAVVVKSGVVEGAKIAAAYGGARYKTWVRTYPAHAPRDWHDELNGLTIPASDKYTLPGGPNGGAQVDGPQDWASVADADEWANCGHSIFYTVGPAEDNTP